MVLPLAVFKGYCVYACVNQYKHIRQVQKISLFKHLRKSRKYLHVRLLGNDQHQGSKEEISLKCLFPVEQK